MEEIIYNTNWWLWTFIVLCIYGGTVTLFERLEKGDIPGFIGSLLGITFVQFLLYMAGLYTLL